MYSSGLSFEESKKLTKVDTILESPKPQLLPQKTGAVTQAPEESRSRKDIKQADGIVKNTKLSQAPSLEPLRTRPAAREALFTIQPMKTRRSQSVEDHRLNARVQTEIAVIKTPEKEEQRQAEGQAVGIVLDNKEGAKKEKDELPQSLVKKSPPLQDSSELKEDQTQSVVKPAESEKVMSEPCGPSEPLKRKSVSESEGELTPEKRPRVSSVSSTSSVSSSISLSASSISSPATPTSATNQRVPPLKVGQVQVLTDRGHISL